MKVRKPIHTVCTRSAEWLSAEAKASASFVSGLLSPAFSGAEESTTDPCAVGLDPSQRQMISPAISPIFCSDRAPRRYEDQKPSQFPQTGQPAIRGRRGWSLIAKITAFRRNPTRPWPPDVCGLVKFWADWARKSYILKTPMPRLRAEYCRVSSTDCRASCPAARQVHGRCGVSSRAA
jgi:hypothetical protein